MVFRQNKLLTFFLIIGVIGAGLALKCRYSAEMHNRAAEITVDYSEVSELAGETNTSVPDVLKKFKDAGAISVAIQGRTIADLVSSGVIDTEDMGSTTKLTGNVADLYDLLSSRGLKVTKQGDNELIVNSPAAYVLEQSVGLPENAILDAKAAGMPIVARITSYPKVTTDEVTQELKDLKSVGVTTVIFASDQVLGFREAVNDVAKVFKEQGMLYGSIEFGKQKGDEKFSTKMLPDIVRVHSVSSAEMAGMDRPSIIERFVKGAKERNIRLSYVRMYDLAGADPLQTNIDYIKDIAKGLKSAGMTLGRAHKFDQPQIPMPALLLMALGAAAGTVLLIKSFAKTSNAFAIMSFAVIAIGLAGMLVLGIMIKLAALFTAIIFPTLAVMNAVSNTPEKPVSTPIRQLIWPATKRYTAAILISLCGGLLVAGMLSKLIFMLHIDQFAGVKFAHLMPIMLIAFAFVAGIGWGPDLWTSQKERAKSVLQQLAAQPMLIGQIAIGFVVLVMFGLVLARSGNDSGVGVSSFELRFRSILDAILYVRPRTKEFLVGHPALFAGLTLALGGRKNWAALLLIVGMFGEVSLVNTFCHIHTPIVISIYRSIIGAIFGLAIGIVLLLIFSRKDKKSASSRVSRSEGQKTVGVSK